MSERSHRSSRPDQPRVKRSRFEPVTAEQNGQAAPEEKPKDKPADQNGLSALEKLQKAKNLLANKDALKAQIQALRIGISQDRKAAQSATGQASQASATKELSYRPAPLRVDEQGREIDASGRVIPKAEAPLSAQPEKQKGPRPEEFFDPNLTDKSFNRLDRKRRAGFEFVKAGAFQKEAEQRRIKAAFGDEGFRQQKERQAGERRPSKEDEAMDPNLIPLGERVAAYKEPEKKLEPIPDVEWWDAGLLVNQVYPEEGEPEIIEKKITIYIEHPVPLDPPAEEAPPPPMPLPLTTKERKKLRTQRRLEKEKEKQELIRQGLLEPPKPKLKLSTFYRSMGVEAAADPTAVEQQVRADQEARMQAHEDRNLANKLTPAEKREKKIRKLTGAAESGEATLVSVFVVDDLSAPQNRFKVQANAQELHMTGAAVITDKAAVIVAEGGPKAQKKYARVVLDRIKWNPDADDDDHDDDDKRPVNACAKVWSGTVKTPAFERFALESCRTEAAARKFLADRGIEHYWDMAMADRKGE